MVSLRARLLDANFFLLVFSLFGSAIPKGNGEPLSRKAMKIGTVPENR